MDSSNPYHYVYGDDILPVAKHPEVPVFWTYTIEPIPRPKEADGLAVDTPFYVDMRWFMEAPMQVYGYTTESPYPEDQRQEDRIWEERQQVRQLFLLTVVLPPLGKSIFTNSTIAQSSCDHSGSGRWPEAL